ncbi:MULTISPECIES: NAD(P)H-quinone oxidoreductase subunit N [unclassified Leptolyngbya]|uniref:NAD(P)H-quinone oxidoreductase subunit N n=1 Tax=unclassified Leptolyngbya TaxID=2650499 RepID=UPI001683A0AD|nr:MULTISPECIES: NAD(P)H-quinone oxidoreductase subunit N [unclassified Leptolyngbya]MBD1909577.1 NAD(P)H-quinone oxidoreductase subunit N [Leptolyngbya sp. FACHB-8]MBD2154115.1 NAD(P)H-quinone oxidoreductase subunit N [Leptolyngbya sp. FACHB-16]
MALIVTGKTFIRDLEQNGALGVYVPLEGGYEGRYQRRVRAAGYKVETLSSRGLGDLASYLLQVHGVRPPHLGKKNLEREGAVGYRYYVPPIATYHIDTLPAKSKGLVLWLLEGNILSQQELEFLTSLPTTDSRIKVIVEMGGDRQVSWKPLKTLLAAA